MCVIFNHFIQIQCLQMNLVNTTQLQRMQTLRQSKADSRDNSVKNAYRPQQGHDADQQQPTKMPHAWQQLRQVSP